MDSTEKLFIALTIGAIVVIFCGLFFTAYHEGERKLKCISLVTDKSATEIMAVCK